MQISKLEESTNENKMCFDNNTNEVLCDRVLKVLADKYSRQILNATKEEPKSANMIVYEANIPVSTVYRRLQNLLDAKLLSISGTINEDGKKFFLYKSKVKEIHTTVNGETIETKLVLVSNNESKM